MCVMVCNWIWHLYVLLRWFTVNRWRVPKPIQDLCGFQGPLKRWNLQIIFFLSNWRPPLVFQEKQNPFKFLIANLENNSAFETACPLWIRTGGTRGKKIHRNFGGTAATSIGPIWSRVKGFNGSLNLPYFHGQQKIARECNGFNQLPHQPHDWSNARMRDIHWPTWEPTLQSHVVHRVAWRMLPKGSRLKVPACG